MDKTSPGLILAELYEQTNFEKGNAGAAWEELAAKFLKATRREIPADILDTATRLHTQDNRCTAFPIFMVREKRGMKMFNKQPCFTDEGAEEYLNADGHNLPGHDIYVASGYRNFEWQRVRDFLMSLVPEPKKED